MAEDELVGNLATETILSCLDPNKINPPVNMEAFARALQLADMTFPQ